MTEATPKIEKPDWVDRVNKMRRDQEAIDLAEHEGADLVDVYQIHISAARNIAFYLLTNDAKSLEKCPHSQSILMGKS